MRAMLLLSAAGILLSGAGAMATRLSSVDQFSPYTLQLSNLGPAYYKQMVARPQSNARTIKEGTPPTIVRRFGRIGGYERDFLAKHVSRQDLIEIASGVAGTRTAAGAHGFFLWGTKPSRIKRRAGGVTLHPVKLPRIGAESRCYAFKDVHKGVAFLNLVCFWRQNRLLGFLAADAFWARRLEVPLIIPFAQLVAMQERRMSSFS